MSLARLTLSELLPCKRVVGVFLFCAAMTVASSAQTLTTLMNFNAPPSPDLPSALIQGFDGNLYGTALEGVASGECQSYYCGTVFRISPQGKFTTLHSFCTQANCPDGQLPNFLLEGTDGNLYGTTQAGGACPSGAGGCGTVFRIGASGQFTTLYTFCVQTNCPDGDGPSGLMQAANGLLYGTTAGGGTNASGTVFQITTAGKLTTLHSFSGSEGVGPNGVIQGRDGNFYGPLYQGGPTTNGCVGYGGCGAIFKMTPQGSLKTIYDFCEVYCDDGSNPAAPLVLGADGNFYGTTQAGGFNNQQHNCDYFGCGTIFKVTPQGKLTTLYTFCFYSYDNDCRNGYAPQSALVQGNDGNVYGTAAIGGDVYNPNCNSGDGCGTVFEITPSGSFTLLHTFESSDGDSPRTLLQSTNGTFYGVTWVGGSAFKGTLYSLSTGLGPFVGVSPGAAKVGGKVIVFGTDLSGTSAVAFNGVAAQFKVRTKTVVIATVPARATTGSITVTTPAGTLSSNVLFEVIP